MQIRFRVKRLNKDLSDPRQMAKAYGDRAKQIRRRLDILGQAACLADVPTGPPDHRHQLGGNRNGQLSVTIKDNWRIVFVPDHDPVPCLPDGGLDTGQVTAVEIIEIVDYHGN
ncbi:system killer suppression protein [Methylobacterium sp. Leaf121]|jgi:proteic killer suppression protein|nr:system killer suppression protein [Methylobacterium sp. Leaf121]USU31484.1 system killer suppression protein [Methylobacterium sp. OTU13CASTA1]